MGFFLSEHIAVQLLSYRVNRLSKTSCITLYGTVKQNIDLKMSKQRGSGTINEM